VTLLVDQVFTFGLLPVARGTETYTAPFRKDNFITVLEILARLSTSPNSPFKGNLLLLRDCNEIMGSVLYGSWNDHHQLTCGDVIACSVGQG
jgi:hypothetical protein